MGNAKFFSIFAETNNKVQQKKKRKVMIDTFKMGWFVDAYKNGQIEYLLSDTGFNKGTAVLPTGAGKSGMIYADIVKRINEAKPGEKIIFQLSAPILKLEAQLLNDFIAVAKEIFPEMIENGEFMFFINSSADGNTYDVKHLNADVMRFSEIDKFKRDKNARFALVASCHKSEYKFAEKIDYLNGFAHVVSYIDEAHLIANETRDDKDYDNLTDEGKQRWESLKEICKGEAIYAVTATPDKYITALINKEAGYEDHDMHILDIPARELIKKNIILPVKTWYSRVANDDSEKITPETCEYFMNLVKEENPNIHHKILVTCSQTEHLDHLRDALGRKYKVFSTCARDGGRFTEDDEFIDIDEVSFIKEVDDYDGDCFVLHIKQLTQGIDVKTLTDAIIYNSTRLNDGVKRTILQIIGRVLRPMKGERGLPEEQRVKKYGNVLFLIGDDDYEAVERQIAAHLLKYYGRDGIKAFTHDITKKGNVTGVKKMFGSGNSGFGDEYFNHFDLVIKALLIDMEDYIKKNILPRHNAFIKLSGGKPNPKLIPMAVANIRDNFAHYKGEYDTHELLSDTDFMKAVSDLFIKYDIQ